MIADEPIYSITSKITTTTKRCPPHSVEPPNEQFHHYAGSDPSGEFSPDHQEGISPEN